MSVKKRGLGRSLNDLGVNELLSKVNAVAHAVDQHDIRNIPVDLLQSGKYQPRRDFDPEALQELADSIKAQGIIQPLILRQIPFQDLYEIVAGERRWRAAQMAGLHEVPSIVRDIPDEAAMAMALIENIQRESLNAIEEAIALQRLKEEFGLTQQQISETVGKPRSTVANYIRLLNLNPEVQQMLEHGDLDMGHARCLLTLSGIHQSDAAKNIVERGLSVRETEKLVNNILKPPAKKTKPKQDSHINDLQKAISEVLGAAVNVQHAESGKGKLVIQYNSLDELDGILAHMGIEIQ